MPIGSREMARQLQLQITAQDDASAVIAGVGGALTALGTQSRYAGYRLFGLGLIFNHLGSTMQKWGQQILGLVRTAVDMAVNFDYSMRLVQTQAQVTGKQFNWLSEQVLKMSERVPQSADELSQGLYEIFSALNVNSRQAINLLHITAQAATAGGFDIQTATRGVIQVLNAYNLGVNKSRHVWDVLVQLWRKSAGTFQEVVAGFGNVTSAAVVTHQSLETMAGSIAFLTKAGRTQAQASISVSRALDQLMRNADKVKKVLGVDIYDAKGNFRDLGVIIDDMAAKLKGLTDKQVAQKFNDMFGAGSIQANRFFRAAIKNVDGLNQSIKDMHDSQGQLKQVWDIMKGAPSVRIKEFQNLLHEVYITFATLLIPVLMKVLKPLKDLLHYFNDLPNHTKRVIVDIITAAGAFLLLGGKIFSLIGGLFQFLSLIKFISMPVAAAGEAAGAAGGGFAAMGGIMGWVLVIAAAVAAVAYVIYRNWGTIKPFLVNLWKDIQKAWKAVLPIIMGFWEGIKKAAQAFVDWFVKEALPVLIIWWDYIKEHWLPVIAEIWSAVVSWARKAYEWLVQTWQSFRKWWDKYWPDIKEAAVHVWHLIYGVISWFVHVVQAIWRHWGKNIMAAAKAIWDFIRDTIKNAMRVIKGVIEIILGIINLHWETVWQGIKDVFGAIWDEIVSLLKNAVKLLWAAIKSLVRLIWEAVKALATHIWDGLKDLPGELYDLGKAIFQSLWDGMKSVWEGIQSWLRDTVSKAIPRIKGPLSKDKVMLVKNGQAVMQGFRKGLEQEWVKTVASLNDMNAQLATRMATPKIRTGEFSALHAPKTYHVHVAGKVERPEDISKELDWLTRTRKI